MTAKLKEIKEEMRRRRHQPIPEQGHWLRQVVSGFFNYHAVPTNFRALAAFRSYATRLWRRALRRRSQKHQQTGHNPTDENIMLLACVPLDEAPVKIMHQVRRAPVEMSR